MSEQSDHFVRRPGEMLFSLLLVIFSVTAFWQSYAISGFKGLSEPGVFPMLASAAMLLSSIVILVDVFKLKQAQINGRPIGWQQGISKFHKEVVPLRLMVMLFLIAAYVIATPLFGFVISSAAFLLLSFWYLWKKRIFISIALTVVSLAIIYIIFRIVFQVVLPQGSLIQGTFMQGWF